MPALYSLAGRFGKLRVLKFRMVDLLINGEKKSFESALSLAQLLLDMGLAGKRVAVELNGAIVARGQHAQTSLKQNDRIEIVVAVGGG